MEAASRHVAAREPANQINLMRAPDKNHMLGCAPFVCDAVHWHTQIGRVAQLVRVLLSHGRGHWFDSSRAHQHRIPNIAIATSDV